LKGTTAKAKWRKAYSRQVYLDRSKRTAKK